MRKLSVIFFTDIVGYSALANRREALALELLEEHRILVRELLGRFGGREIQVIGDAFLIEFASAEQAVHCALEIQRALARRNRAVARERRIGLRIGIHLSDILLSEGDVYGDGVNIAARLLSVAGWGEICISENVYAQIRGRIAEPVAHLGPRYLKNISHPVVIHCLGHRPGWWHGMRRCWQRLPAELRRAVNLTVLGILLAAGITHLADTGRASADGRRIAVLPFTAADGAEEAYLVDGLTEELTSALSRHAPGAVISSQTVRQYLPRAKTATALGQTLNASSLVEGTVRKLGDRVEIAVRLFDRAHARYVWSRNFAGRIDQVFQLNQTLTREVTAALGGAGGEAVTSAPQSQAYFAYLRGKYFLNQRTREGLRRAIQEFESATRLDPHFAGPYAMEAIAYNLLAFYGYLDPRAAYPTATALAEKSLLLDNQAAEAILFLAQKKAIYDHDWDGAEVGYRKAIELAPRDATAHQWFAQTLMSLGRFPEAEREALAAVELDPLALPIQMTLGIIHSLAGEPERASQVFRSVMTADPSYIYAHFSQGLTALEQGNYAESLAELEIARQLSHDAPMVTAALANASARAGRREQAIAIGRVLTEKSRRGFFPPYLLAEVAIGLGREEETIVLLRRAVEVHDTHLLFLACDPMFRALHHRHAFQEILGQLGLPRMQREIAGSR